ncbi:MAG: hypothetical protein ACOC3V_00525 [bacterium]
MITIKKLIERSVSEISMFDVEKFDPDNFDRNSIIKHFELLYELEFKYSMIKNNKFTGYEKRKDNIMSIIEEKSKKVISSLADTFELVFSLWLENHAITKPEKWARKRFYDEGDTLIEIYGLKEAFRILISELERYSAIDSEEDLLKAMYDEDLEIAQEILDWLVAIKKELAESMLYDYSLDEFNKAYNQKFDNEKEAEEFIDFYFSYFDKDFISLYKYEQEAIDDLVSSISDLDIFSYEKNIPNHINMDEFFMLAYEHILFPLWYRYWKSQGIDKTRKDIEAIYKKLKNINKLQLSEQFLIINVAKNINHQNGSMMNYYYDIWEVDHDDLKYLSNMNTKKWEKELKEIGVEI